MWGEGKRGSALGLGLSPPTRPALGLGRRPAYEAQAASLETQGSS